MGFQRTPRKNKDAAETPKEIETVEKGADIPQRLKESQKKTNDLDPGAPLTKNFTVPANDHLLDMIQRAAVAESERTGYKVSGRMLCHKLLKEQLAEILD